MMLKWVPDSVVRWMAVVTAIGMAGCRSPGTDRVRLVSTGAMADGEVQREYRFQPGDQIQVQVYREPQLSGEFRVDEQGRIRHPLFGPFRVGELTVYELEAFLTERLSERYLVDPKVIVNVISAQSSQVVILGEVKTPGVRKIPFGESITLLQAVAMAGGFTDLASVDRITVTRRVDGREVSVRVRVSRVISGRDPDPELEPNDMIMVPQIVF